MKLQKCIKADFEDQPLSDPSAPFAMHNISLYLNHEARRSSCSA